jgi:hypothetical protein
VSHTGRAASTSGDDQTLSGRENHLWRNQPPSRPAEYGTSQS